MTAKIYILDEATKFILNLNSFLQFIFPQRTCKMRYLTSSFLASMGYKAVSVLVTYTFFDSNYMHMTTVTIRKEFFDEMESLVIHIDYLPKCGYLGPYLFSFSQFYLLDT